MRSHHCRFALRRIAGPVLVPLLVTGAIALLLHAGGRLGLLPSPRPILDVDRTILVHQVDASARPSDARIVLLGDSSCLMNVDALLLSRELNRPVLNLGTLSYLDLDAFSLLLSRHLEAGSEAPEAVLLLVHPNFVRGGTPSAAHVIMLRSYVEDRVPPGPEPWRDLLGLTLAEERLRSRLPVPLEPMEFRRHYGFASDLYRYMERNRGSALDPGVLDPEKHLKGSRDYHVARAHRRGASRLAIRLPGATRLLIGLSPLPQSFLEGGTGLLSARSGLFPRGIPLEELPAALPDGDFASRAHLRPEAVDDYTLRLAGILSSRAFLDSDAAER